MRTRRATPARIHNPGGQMGSTATPEIGQAAPDFKLKGPGGQPVTLSEYKGQKNVVLVFYPLAFSRVCSHQLPGVQKVVPEIEASGGVVLGISVDSHYSNEAFAQKLGLTFPLLSDWDHEVSKAYGVFLDDKRYSDRATFIVDRGGTIAYQDVAEAVHDPARIPGVDSVVAKLKELK
jgi:peroxiredoxin (alkyl hydroperoxide reductase subunit C)